MFPLSDKKSTYVDGTKPGPVPQLRVMKRYLAVLASKQSILHIRSDIYLSLFHRKYFELEISKLLSPRNYRSTIRYIRLEKACLSALLLLRRPLSAPFL